MNCIALIPARGGSKGIPGKNIALLAGKPLIAHTIDAAKGAAGVSRVVVSTDSEDIASVARAYGAEVLVRPAEIAADDTLMIDVLRHAVDALSKDGEPDAILLLQPTSPLRTSGHIEEAVALFEKTKTDSLVSVVRVPHNFLPNGLYEMGDDALVPLSANDVTRRQDKKVLYARNGPVILMAHPSLIRAGRLYGDRVVPYVMGREESVDIDEPQDLAYAAFLLERR